MKRSIPRSLWLAVALFTAPARLLAVWPPSTAFEEEAASANVGARAENLSPVLQSDVQLAAAKLEQDERRLEQLVQQLKEDEATLKKLSEKNSAE